MVHPACCVVVQTAVQAAVGHPSGVQMLALRRSGAHRSRRPGSGAHLRVEHRQVAIRTVAHNQRVAGSRLRQRVGPQDIQAIPPRAVTAARRVRTARRRTRARARRRRSPSGQRLTSNLGWF